MVRRRPIQASSTNDLYIVL